jgi:glyoxylase-like metal-dependent hydrolase (beta-lactamase superfamily II)
MSVISEVVPGVLRIELAFVNVYVCADGDGLTLFDTGIATSAPLIMQALRERNLDLARLDQIVVSHYHDDHRGAAADLAAWSSARVLVHAADASVVRGDAPQAEPDITEAERQFFDNLPEIPPVPPCRVDRELVEGDVVDVLGGARVVSLPGHTAGSMAVFAEGRSVLFTGDVVASFDGRALMGPFNADRAQAWASFQRVASMEFDIACVGHGAPIVGGASARLRDAAQRLERAGAGR